MSKARVSLSAVSVFHKNTDVMKTAADRIIMALTSIDQCITLINRERLKLDNEVSNVSKSMVSIENKISIIKKEIVKIQAKLSDLNIQLANTEKTIEVEHTCRIGTDENGNPEYSTYTTIEPNPAYLALEAEIDAVSHQLDAMKTKNDQANSINSQLNGTKQNLQKNKDSLALSQQELNKIKGEIQTGASQIFKCSASASMVLGKAEKAIQKYLNENIGTVSVMNSKSIVSIDSINGKCDNTKILSGFEKDCKKIKVVETADFSDFDPEVAKSVVNALSDAKKDFSELRIKYVGSISTQTNKMKSELENYYYDRLKKDTMGRTLSKDERKAAASREADMWLSQYGLNEVPDSTIARSMKIPSWLDPTEGELQKYNGIGINDSYANDNKLFTRMKEKEVELRHKPIGCNTPRATADHEIGHEIDKLLNARYDYTILDLYDKYKHSKDPVAELSGYAYESMLGDSERPGLGIAEFIAESYSEYRNNEVPREFAKAVYNRLIELQKRR